MAADSHATPYTFEYLLNLQRQLGANWVVEVGYLGSLSRHLYGFRDANQPIPGTTSLGSRTPFALLDASGQPVAPGPDGGIQGPGANFGTPMMGVITVLGDD